ncbi:MAG: hypothetical protein IKL10_07750 [Clostridia bacterium]|nr:hypothetical protein [Clostridia bacterium]
MPTPDREVRGGYVGDLLSWVMGRAEADNAWITIMTNVNIAAVGALSDVAVVIIAEGARPDAQVIETAQEKGVNIVLTDKTAYEVAVAISADI